MNEGGAVDNGSPKLYDHKPRKAQLKQFRGQQKENGFSSPPVTGIQTAPPPPPPKEPFFRRYKFLWPVILVFNLGYGVYFFTRASTQNKDTVEEEKDAASPISVKDTTAPLAKTSASTTPTASPVIKREPIPVDQQRELFKWMLEEKRKIKPKDVEEKQRIEEEKDLLKNLLRSKSIPSI